MKINHVLALALTPTAKGNMLSPAMQRQWPGSRAMAALLPTPAANSYGSNQGGAAGRTGPVRPSLDSMVRQGMLPTPTKSDADAGGKGSVTYARGNPTLKGAVEAMGILPTPSARDWKSSAASPETLERNSRPLNETARASGIAGTAASLLVLVEWMMGYPAGWLARALPPSGTRSSQRSPKP